MNHFRQILVHIDARNHAHPVLDRAVELAKEHGAHLTLVDVIPQFSPPIQLAAVTSHQDLQQSAVAKKQEILNELVQGVQARGVSAAAKVLVGKTSAEIIAEVKRSHHDLVIKDAKGPDSPRRGYFGTTATRLMRFCPCTVWAYGPARSGGPERVVAAVDATAADERHASLNTRILTVAQALSHGRPLHVVHAWHVYGQRLIQDYMKREEFDALVQDAFTTARSKLNGLLQPFGMSMDAPEVHLLRGQGEEQIAKFVNEQKFDVVVMGTVGRSGISGFIIGNTAETLLDHVECSVVAVKPADLEMSA